MRQKKKRVLLQVDYFTKKVYDVKEYSGDGKGIDAKVDDINFLKNAEERGLDVYYKNKKLVESSKDPEEFHNQKKTFEEEVSKLKAEERKVFASYVGNRSNSALKNNLIQISQLKNEKRRALIALVKNNVDKIRTRINGKFKRVKFKYYCSVCMIIRDDNEYLEEWLNWHIGQGVEHFYIYDHNSRQLVSEFMKTLSEKIQEKVTVIGFGGRHDFAQHDAYNNCLRKYGRESRWIGFIDSDEMVRVKNKKTLPEFLKDFEDCAGLFIGWVTYNANGQKAKQNLPVRERFPNPSEFNNQNGVGKVFVQPFCMRQMLTHNGYVVDGFEIVDENKNRVEEGAAWASNLTTEKICIDHYYTKSYEEWLAKISRGSCDPYYSRRYEEFFKYNPDLEYCREEVFPVQLYEVSENKKQIKLTNKKK